MDNKLIASLPKGKKVKVPITKQDFAHGIQIKLMIHSTPASHHANPIKTPPSKNQIILPIVRIMPLY